MMSGRTGTLQFQALPYRPDRKPLSIVGVEEDVSEDGLGLERRLENGQTLHRENQKTSINVHYFE